MHRTTSAGIVLYRQRDGEWQVLLVHPGGPYFAGKDEGVWSIPKGELSADEEPLAAAQREFHEETGFTATGPFRPLTPVRQPSGKWVLAFAAAGDADVSRLRSNSFELEWPPKSGVVHEFPEVDRGAWFSIDEARRKISPGQRPVLDEMSHLLIASGRPPSSDSDADRTL